MKTIIQITALALLSLFFPNSAFGQLYEVSLDAKIDRSTLIVEGKVIESQCYRADDGNIYTANKVQLVSVLKGDYRENYLTATTWGGEMDGEMQSACEAQKTSSLCESQKAYFYSNCNSLGRWQNCAS